jgi:hypothetical protein
MFHKRIRMIVLVVKTTRMIITTTVCRAKRLVALTLDG